MIFDIKQINPKSEHYGGMFPLNGLEITDAEYSRLKKVFVDAFIGSEKFVSMDERKELINLPVIGVAKVKILESIGIKTVNQLKERFAEASKAMKLTIEQTQKLREALK